MSLSTRRAAALLAAGAALGACSESTAPASPAAMAYVANAFASASPGYDQHTTSYDAAGQTGTWAPERGPGGRGRGRPDAGRDPVGLGGFMGGGMQDAFLGGPAGGFGRRGPFGGPFGGAAFTDASCTFAASTGRVTCAPVTRHGLTFTRSVAYATASGAAQAAFDSTTTNSVNVQTSVSGTATFTGMEGGRGRGHGHGFGPGFGRDSGAAALRIARATSTVASASTRTVTGLAAGSTARTVAGASAGREETRGVTTDSVSFTSVRTMGDTTTGLVVPVRASGNTDPVYPTAGTVVRSMTATVTFSGQSPVTSTRREVVTYDGTATAKVVITRDGTTRNCTVALPRGRPSCS
jgi:hypothetical protein